jgi:hypothetical protein
MRDIERQGPARERQSIRDQTRAELGEQPVGARRLGGQVD